MDSIQCLAMVTTLTIGTLGLGTSTSFPASSHASHMSENYQISYASEFSAGYTQYNTEDNSYRIYDTKGDSLGVGVLFYIEENENRENSNRNNPLIFDSCNEGPHATGCVGNLSAKLPEGNKGKTVLCMETAVAKNPDVDRGGRDARKYEKYSKIPTCFHFNPPKENSSG